MNWRSLFSYGFLAFPLAFGYLPLYILVPDFYAREFGLSLTVLGIWLLVARLVDALCAPVLGYLSDRFSRFQRTGMLISAAVFGLGFAILFIPCSAWPLASFNTGMILCAIASTYLYINLNATGALWQRDRSAKVSISATREGLALVGVLFGCILPVALSQSLSVRESYAFYALILLVLMYIAIMRYIKWHQQHFNRTDISLKRVSLIAYLETMSRDERAFFFVMTMSALALACTSVLISFFVTRYLMLPNVYIGVFLLIYFLAALLGVPLFKLITKRIGLLKSWLVATVLVIIFFIFGFGLTPNSAMGYVIICFMTGLTLGGELMISAAVLAVLIDNDKQAQLASGYYALSDFINKFALALASIGLLPLLDMVGLKLMGTNTDTATTTLLLVYIGIPCLLKCCALVRLFFWQRNTGVLK